MMDKINETTTNYTLLALLLLTLSACSTLTTQQACHALATNPNPLNGPTGNSKLRRDKLWDCVATHQISHESAKANATTDLTKLRYNEAGAHLEAHNIWFYLEEDTKQLVGLNLYNTTTASLQTITTGFHKDQCIRDHRDNVKYDFLLDLHLKQPLPPRQQTVALWLMPTNLRLQDGCLDILNASQ